MCEKQGATGMWERRVENQYVVANDVVVGGYK